MPNEVKLKIPELSKCQLDGLILRLRMHAEIMDAVITSDSNGREYVKVTGMATKEFMSNYGNKIIKSIKCGYEKL